MLNKLPIKSYKAPLSQLAQMHPVLTGRANLEFAFQVPKIQFDLGSEQVGIIVSLIDPEPVRFYWKIIQKKTDLEEVAFQVLSTEPLEKMVSGQFPAQSKLDPSVVFTVNQCAVTLIATKHCSGFFPLPNDPGHSMIVIEKINQQGAYQINTLDLIKDGTPRIRDSLVSYQSKTVTWLRTVEQVERMCQRATWEAENKWYHFAFKESKFRLFKEYNCWEQFSKEMEDVVPWEFPMKVENAYFSKGKLEYFQGNVKVEIEFPNEGLEYDALRCLIGIEKQMPLNWGEKFRVFIKSENCAKWAKRILSLSDINLKGCVGPTTPKALICANKSLSFEDAGNTKKTGKNVKDSRESRFSLEKNFSHSAFNSSETFYFDSNRDVEFKIVDKEAQNLHLLASQFYVLNGYTSKFQDLEEHVDYNCNEGRKLLISTIRSVINLLDYIRHLNQELENKFSLKHLFFGGFYATIYTDWSFYDDIKYEKRKALKEVFAKEDEKEKKILNFHQNDREKMGLLLKFCILEDDEETIRYLKIHNYMAAVKGEYGKPISPVLFALRAKKSKAFKELVKDYDFLKDPDKLFFECAKIGKSSSLNMALHLLDNYGERINANKRYKGDNKGASFLYALSNVVWWQLKARDHLQTGEPSNSLSNLNRNMNE